MIFGNCPFEGCTGSHAVGVPENTPAFAKQVCGECKREYWIYYSRWNPQAYTPEDFAKEFDVNEETKVITKKELT